MMSLDRHLEHRFVFLIDKLPACHHHTLVRPPRSSSHRPEWTLQAEAEIHLVRLVCEFLFLALRVEWTHPDVG